MLISILLCCLFCVGLLVAEYRQNLLGVWIMKPLAALCYLAAALSADALATPYGCWIFIGLCLSFAGDILLIPKQSEPAFLAGIGSFLLAHVAYTWALLQLDIAFGYLPWAVVMGVVGVGAVMLWLWRHLDDFFRFAVPLYTVVIVAMVATSSLVSFATGAFIYFLAAALFAISDLSVAADRLIQERFVNRLWGLPLYFAAQLLFGVSLLGAIP